MLEASEGKPVEIGRLQRYATDKAMAANAQFFGRAPSTGKRVAIVGAGPAGLACAHRLAMHGHAVEIFEAKKKSGGLNEYGIAAYKTVDGFARAEVDYVAAIGGIEIRNGKALGRDFSLADLTGEYDAVFLGMGLGGVNALEAKGEDADGVCDAVDFIADLRQAKNLGKLDIGRRVVVIGGGMTAIDAAIQSKLLGAEEVTICYRRGADAMKASRFEQELAAAKGVTIRHWLAPKKILSDKGKVEGIKLEYTEEKKGRLEMTGESLKLACDQVFKAIGQKLVADDLGDGAPALERGKIKVDDEGRTSLAGVWAGGDCSSTGDDLTVSAVAQGRDAAESINKSITGR